jgi:hypothetical protein
METPPRVDARIEMISVGVADEHRGLNRPQNLPARISSHGGVENEQALSFGHRESAVAQETYRYAHTPASPTSLP